MQPTNKQISLEFSGGNFEYTYDYLADDVSFNIVGNELISGKDKLIEFCTKITEYFTTVSTKFSLDNIIVDSDLVAISGKAEFFVEKENRTNFISSCDVYRFADGKLKEITSYCIST